MSSGRVDKGSLTNKTKEKFLENVKMFTLPTLFSLFMLYEALLYRLDGLLSKMLKWTGWMVDAPHTVMITRAPAV